MFDGKLIWFDGIPINKPPNGANPQITKKLHLDHIVIGLTYHPKLT
jgi:hypothetical protein